MNHYHISYKVNNELHHTVIVDLGYLRSGFWVNNRYEFTNDSTATHLILPHMVTRVTKDRSKDV